MSTTPGVVFTHELMPKSFKGNKDVRKTSFWRAFVSRNAFLFWTLVLMSGIVAFLYLKVSQEGGGGESQEILTEEPSQVLKPPTETIAPDLTVWDYCQKESAYPMKARFRRSLSLLLERNSLDNPTAKTAALRFYLVPIAPCLDIQYCEPSQMLGADGLFFFSSKMANRERLPVCVSKAYQEEDDLLTALLLAHEATHAIQFVMDQTGTTYGEIYADTCFGREAMAFTEQTLFLISLTEGEADSLLSRALVGSYNPRIATLRELINISGQMAIRCEGEYKQGEFYQDVFFTCIAENLEKYFREAVKKDPFYQRQCS
jgi:hypothetical protein